MPSKKSDNDIDNGMLYQAIINIEFAIENLELRVKHLEKIVYIILASIIAVFLGVILK